MKSLYTTLSFIVILLSLFMSGCDLITKEPDTNRAQPTGNDLIFTEIFTLPPDRFYTYSWIEVYNPTNAPFQWYKEVYPAIIFICGEGPIAYNTTNDGRDWNEMNLGVSDETILKGVVFPWPDTGIVIGTGGTILRILRREGVFNIEPVPDANKPADFRNQNLNDISGQTQNPSAWACGDSGRIIRTVNRGTTWRNYYSPSPPTTKNLNSIDFFNFDAIYCVGDSGTLLRSPRANVWEKMTPPDEYSNINYYGVKFISKDTGFAVGENGAIIYTFTAGNVWIAQNSHVTSTLRDVFFSNDSRFNRLVVWAVGDNGVVVKTTDRGTTWEKIETGFETTLRVVTFVDSLRGGAFGDEGTILLSESAGEDWYSNNRWAPNMGDIYAVYYFPPTVYERDYYTMQYKAKRKAFFYDPETYTINYSVFTKIDTGTLEYNPFLVVDPRFPFTTVQSIPSGGFTILNNDSIRFTTHHTLGPGQTSVLNASVAYYADTSFLFGYRPVLWDLLESGEIRLMNYHLRFDRFTNEFLEFTQQTVDMVRWGNYVPGVGDFGDSLYLNNVPADYIPEWYSLARYANDVGTADMNQLSTVNSFYFAKDPIPGWYSQKRK